MKRIYEDVGRWVVAEARKRLRAKLCSVMLFSEKERELFIIASAGLPKRVVDSVKVRLGEGIAGWVAKEREPLFVENIEKDERFRRKSKRRYYTPSLISVPIKDKYHFFGILNINNKEDRRPFTEDELEIAKCLAEDAAGRFASKHLAQLEEERKRLWERNRELDQLLSLSSKITSSLYLSEVTKTAIEDIFVLLRPDVVLLLLFDPNKIWFAGKGKITAPLIRSAERHLKKKMGLLCEKRPDLAGFEWIKEEKERDLARNPSEIFANSLSLPIFVGEKELGILSCCRKTTFSSEDLRIFTILLNYTAIAIEKALLHQKTEEELEKVKDELVHSERMTAVGRMASKISHDIRNPLSVVLISAMLAKQRTKDPTLLQFLNRIERSGNKMTWLIEELSDFAKEIKIAKKKIDIAHVIQSSLQLLEHQLRQIEVRLEISELPQIMADSRRLEQVFCNLIQNAAQAMDEKGILRIRAGLKDDSVYIEIEDAGHGIADEIKKKIFDPFFTTKSNGIGLGLSIVKEIIDLHKGSISCESKLGEGTRFTILLPIK